MQKKFIGEGLNGKCYELKTGEILKIFKIPKEISEMKKYKAFLEYKNDSIIFPHKFITNGKYFTGYISKKASGMRMDNCLSLYNFNDISKNLIKLENDIYLLSSDNILMCDNRSENMFYDGQKFSVIDVDEYFFYDCPNEFDNSYCFSRNISKVENAIYEIFCNEISKCNLSINDKHKILSNFRKYIFWEYGPSIQILKYKKIIDDVLKDDVLSLENVKQITKKRR